MQKNEVIRESLKEISNNEERYSFEAEFKRFGVDRRFPHLEKALLVNVNLVKEDGTKVLVTDHVWVAKSKRWKRLVEIIKEGDKISFTAEVEKYLKEGKKNYFTDYCLVSIRHLSIIKD